MRATTENHSTIKGVRRHDIEVLIRTTRVDAKDSQTRQCAVTGETDTDTTPTPAATVGRRQTRSELPSAKFRAPSAGGTAGVLVGWSAGGWCRRCVATERVTHLDLGQGWTFPLSFLVARRVHPYASGDRSETMPAARIQRLTDRAIDQA